MATIKITQLVQRTGASLGISASTDKKCGLLEVTDALRDKLKASGADTDWLPATGTVLVGVELGAEFSFNFGMQDNGGAVVPSIRGINPLTGLRAGLEPWTSGRGDFCPKDPSHGRLGHNGKCTACGHTWSAANYLVTSPSADLPGWRTGEGEFRKFVATTDMMKDVAMAVDKDSAVPALGFAFYKSSKPMPTQSWSPFVIYDWYSPWIYRRPGWVYNDFGNRTYYGIGVPNTISLTNSVSYSSTCDTLSYGHFGTKGAEGMCGRRGAEGEPGLPTGTSLAVGASKDITEVSEQKSPPLLPQDLHEEPLLVLDAVLLSWGTLSGLVATANSTVASGPLKGIPLS